MPRLQSRAAYERRIHAIAMGALDLTAADRRAVVEEMFHRRRRDAVSYWLQTLLSMGIATVGLVLGSTAVVIGAMLIAPLMGPIVELGMGLVVGSAVLTLRSFARMAASVLVVIGGAAVLTLLLPFHEVTSEIASRTSPTALDLLLAVFVAVAAAFTTARPGSDAASAAAGTAIGIALVPPLGVIGFGLGVRDLGIAGGATLLFLTNLTAILLVSVLFFWMLGFERVEHMPLEDAALREAEPSGALRRAVETLRGVFGSRYSRAIRVGLPMVLVAAVFVPLVRGLQQVAWEVRTRSAVSRILDRSLESRRAVQSQVSVSRGAIATQLYLVGSAEEAATLERELTARLAAATGVVPAVRVVAVPDADALRQAAGRDGSPAPQVPDLAALRQQLGGTLRAQWPEAELGPLVAWWLEVPDSGAALIYVEHIGPAAGRAAEAMLARAVSDRVGASMAVATRAFPPEEITAPLGEGEEWLPAFNALAAAVRRTERLHGCVRIPSTEALAGRRDGLQVAGAVRLAAVASSRIQIDSAATRWSARYAAGPCAPADTARSAPRP